MDPQLLVHLFDTFGAEGQNGQLPWGISASDNIALEAQGDGIRFESNGREWRVLQVGTTEDEMNLPPYRSDTQLRDAARVLPPVCFAPLVSQYTRLLRDPRWEVRHVPRIMEAMLNDRVLFHLMDTSPLLPLSDSRVSAMTRWWGVMAKPVLRYENNTGRPLMSLIDSYGSLPLASSDAVEGQQGTGKAVSPHQDAGSLAEHRSSAREEQIGDTADSAAVATATSSRMSLEEVRQGYHDIKTVLTLIAATSAPYRCSRPPNASVSGCTARLVFCKDPSTIYLGLLLNSALRGLPRKVLCSMSVFRLIAEGWGSSPSFGDILRACWEEYSDVVRDIRALLGIADSAAEIPLTASPAASSLPFSCMSTSTGASAAAPPWQHLQRRQMARRRQLPPMRLPSQSTDSGEQQGRHAPLQRPGESPAGASSSGAGGGSFPVVSSSSGILPHTSLRQTRTTAGGHMQAVELGIPIQSATSSGGASEVARQSAGNNTGDVSGFVTALLGNAFNSLSGLQLRRNPANSLGAGRGSAEAAGAGSSEGDAQLGNSGVSEGEHCSAPFKTEDANAICHESMLECAQTPELLLWWARCRLLAYQLLDSPSRVSVESTDALEYFREVWACTPLIREILEDDQEALLVSSSSSPPLSMDEQDESEEMKAVRASKKARLEALQERARRMYATLVGAVADLSKFWFSIRVSQSTVNAVASGAPETNTVWSIINATVPSRRRFQREEFSTYAEHWQYGLLVDDYVTQPMCFRVSTRGRTMVTQLLHILSEYPTFYPALVARTLAMLNRREMIVAELNERLVNAVARCLRFYLPPMPPALAVPPVQATPPSVSAHNTTVTGTAETPMTLRLSTTTATEAPSASADETAVATPLTLAREPPPGAAASQRSWSSPEDSSSHSSSFGSENAEDEVVGDVGTGSGGDGVAAAQSAVPPFTGGGDGDTSTRSGIDYEALVAARTVDETDDDDEQHGDGDGRCVRNGKNATGASLRRRLREEEAKMPVITVKAYDTILTCLDVLRMLVRNGHISVNPMNLLFTLPASSITSAPASTSPTDSLACSSGSHIRTGDAVGTDTACHSLADTSATTTSAMPPYEASLPKSQCDLYTLLHQLVYQTRYGPLSSAALRLFSACVHYNVRDMVPLFAERGLLNTVLAIARRPRIFSKDVTTSAAPLRFALDMVEENGLPNIPRRELAQATSILSSFSEPSPLLIEHPPPELLERYIPAEDAYVNTVAVRLVLPEFVEAMTVHKATHSVFLKHTEWITAVTQSLTVTPAMSAVSLLDIEALFEESAEACADHEAGDTNTSEDAGMVEDKERCHLPSTAFPSLSIVATSAARQVDSVQQQLVDHHATQQAREDRVLRCRSSTAYTRLLHDLKRPWRRTSAPFPAPAVDSSTDSTDGVASQARLNGRRRPSHHISGVSHSAAPSASIDVVLTRMVELHRLHLKREEVGYKTLQGAVKEVQRVLAEVLQPSSLITGHFCPALRAELSLLSQRTHDFAQAVRAGAVHPHPLLRSAADGDDATAAGQCTIAGATSGSGVGPRTRADYLHLLIQAIELCRTLNNFFAFFSALDWDGHQRRYRLSRRSAEQQASQQELAMVLESTTRDFHLAVNQLWSLMGSHAPLQRHDTDAAEASGAATTAAGKEREAVQEEHGATNGRGHALLTRAHLGSPLDVYEQGTANGGCALLGYVQATIGPYLHARIFGDYLRSAPPSTWMEATLKSTVQCILHFSSRDFIAAPEIVMARESGADSSGGGGEVTTDVEGSMSKAMRRRCLKAMKRVLEGRGLETHRRGSIAVMQQHQSGPGAAAGEGRSDDVDVRGGAQHGADEAAVAERVYYHTSESPCKDVISSVLRPLSVGDGAFLRQLLEAWRVSTSSSSGGGGGSSGPGRRDSEATPWRSVFSEIMEFVVDALVVRTPYTADEVTGLLRSLQVGTQHSSISTNILSLYDRNAEAGATTLPAALPVVMGGRDSSEVDTSAAAGMDASDRILQSMLQDGRSLLNEPSTAWMTAEAWVQATTSMAAAGDVSSLGPSSAAAMPHQVDGGPVARAEAAAAGGAASEELLPHSAFSSIVVPSVLADPHARDSGRRGGRRSSLGRISHGVDSEDSAGSSTTLSSSLPTSPPPLPTGVVGGGPAAAGGLARPAGGVGSGAGGGTAASAATTAHAGAAPHPTPLFVPINAAKALQQWAFLSLFTGRRAVDQPTRNFFYLSPYRRDGHVRPALPLNVTGLLRTIRSDMQAAFENAVRSASADVGSLDPTPRGSGIEVEHARQSHPSRMRAKQRNSQNSDDEEATIIADVQGRTHMFRPTPRHDNRAGATADNGGGGGGRNASSASARARTACEWFDLDPRVLAVVSLPSCVDVAAFLREINFVAARHVLWELAVLGAVCTGVSGATPDCESTPLHDMLSRAAQFMILLSRLVFTGDAASVRRTSATDGDKSPTSATAVAAASFSPTVAALKDQLQRCLVYMAVLLMNFLESCDARTRGRHCNHVESLLYCVLDVWPKLPGFPMVPHVYVAAMEAVAQLKPETLSRMSFQALAREWQDGTTKSASMTTAAALAASADLFPSSSSPQLREREVSTADDKDDDEEGEGSDMQRSRAEEARTIIINDGTHRLNQSPWARAGLLQNSRVGAPSPGSSPVQDRFGQHVTRLQQPRRSQPGAPLSVVNEWGRALPWVCDIAAGRIFPLDTLSEAGHRLLRKRTCRALWGMWTGTNTTEQQYVVAYMLHRVLSNVRENVVLLEYIGVLLTQLRGVVLVEALALTPLPRAIVKAVQQAIEAITAEQHAEEARQQALSGPSSGAVAAAQRELRQRRRRYYARIQMTLHGQLVSFLSIFQNVRSDAPLVADPLARTAATPPHVQTMGAQCSYFDSTRNTFCWNGHQCHRQHVVPVNGQRGRDGEEHRFGLNTFGLGTQRALDEMLSVLEHHGFPCPPSMSATTTTARGASSAAGAGAKESAMGTGGAGGQAVVRPHGLPEASAPVHSSGAQHTHQPSQRVVRVPFSAGTANPNAAPSRPQTAYEVERRTWQDERVRQDRLSTRSYAPAGAHGNGDDEGSNGRPAMPSPAALATMEDIGPENYQRLLRDEGLPWLPLSARPAPPTSSLQQHRGSLSGPRELDYAGDDMDEETRDVLSHLTGAFRDSRRERSPLRHRLLNPLTGADFRTDSLRRSIIPHCALFGRDVCEEVVRMTFDFMAARLRDEAAEKVDAELERKEQQQQQQGSTGCASFSGLAGNIRSLDRALSASPQFPSSPVASPVSTTTLPFPGVLPAAVAVPIATAKVVAARLTLPRVEVVECGVDEVIVHFLLTCFSTYYTTCMYLVRTHRPAGSPAPPAATYVTPARSTALASSRDASVDATSAYTDSLSVLCAYITHIDPPNREKAMLLSGLLLTDMLRLEEDVWQHMVTVLRTTVQIHRKGRRLTEKAYAALSAHHLRLTRVSATTPVEPPSPLREEGRVSAVAIRKNFSHRKPRAQVPMPVSANDASPTTPPSQPAESAEQEELYADDAGPGAAKNEVSEAAAMHRYLIPLSIFLANLEPYIIRHPIAFYHAFRRYCEVRWVRAATGEMPAAWLGVWVRPRPPATSATTTSGSRGHSPRATRRPRAGAALTPSRDFVERVQCFVQHLARNVEAGQGRATHGAILLAVVVQFPGVCEALLSLGFEMPVPARYAALLSSTASARGAPANSAEALATPAAVSGEGEGEPATSVRMNGDGGSPAMSRPPPVIAVPPFLALALYFCSALGEACRSSSGSGSGGNHIAGSADFATAIFAHDPTTVSNVVVRTLSCLVTAVEAAAMSEALVAQASSQAVKGADSVKAINDDREINAEVVTASTHDGVAAVPGAASGVPSLVEDIEPAAQQQQQQQLEAKNRVCRIRKTLTRCLHDVLCFLWRGSPQPATAALPARQRATQQRMGLSSVVQEAFLRFFNHLGRLGLLDLLFRMCLLQSCEHGRDATSLLQLLAHQLLASGEFKLAETLSSSQRRYAAQQQDMQQQQQQQQQHRPPRGLPRSSLWISQGRGPASLRRPYPDLTGQELPSTLNWPPSQLRGAEDQPSLRHAFDHLEALLARDAIHSGSGDTVRVADNVLDVTSSFAGGEHGMGAEVPDTSALHTFLSFEEEPQEGDVEGNDDDSGDNGDDSDDSGRGFGEGAGRDGAAAQPAAPNGIDETDTWSPMQPVRRAAGVRSVQSNHDSGEEGEPNVSAHGSVQRRSLQQALSSSPPMADASVVRMPISPQLNASTMASQRTSLVMRSGRDDVVRGGVGDDDEHHHRRAVALATYEEAVIRSLRAEEAMGRHRRRSHNDGHAEAAAAVEDDADYSTPEEGDEEEEIGLFADVMADDGADVEEDEDEDDVGHLLRNQPEMTGFFVPSPLNSPRTGAGGGRRRREDDNDDDDSAGEDHAGGDGDNDENDDSTSDDDAETYEEGEDDNDDEGDAALYYDNTGRLLSGRDHLEDALLDMYTPELVADGGDSGALRHGLTQQTAGGLTYLNDDPVGRPTAAATTVERAQSFAACAYRAIVLSVRPLAAHNVVETETPPLPALRASEEEAPAPEVNYRSRDGNDGSANPAHELSVEVHQRSAGAAEDFGSPFPQLNPATSHATTTVAPTSGWLPPQRRPLPSTSLPSTFSAAIGVENTPSDQIMRRGRDSRSPLEVTVPSTTITRASTESASHDAPLPTTAATSQRPGHETANTAGTVSAAAPAAAEVQPDPSTTGEGDMSVGALTARILALFAAGDPSPDITVPADPLPPRAAQSSASAVSEQPTSATAAAATSAAPEPWEGILNPQFLIEMPEDVRSEILFDSMSLLRGADEREVQGQRTRLYPGFLSAMPEDAQRHAVEVEARWVRVTGADNNASELYQTLLLVDAETRRDLLLQCDLELLRSYPEVLREATELRAEVERAREEAERATRREQERRQHQREQAEQQQQQANQHQSRLWMLGAWDSTRDARGGSAAVVAAGARTSLPVLRDMETVEGVMRVMFGPPAHLYEVVNQELFLARRLYRCEMVLQALELPTSSAILHSMSVYTDRAAASADVGASGLMLSPLHEDDAVRDVMVFNHRNSVHRGGNTIMRHAPPRGAPIAAASTAAAAAAAAGHYHLPQFPSLQLPLSTEFMASDSAVSPLSPSPHTQPSGGGGAFATEHSASGPHAAPTTPLTSLAALSDSMVPVQESLYHPLALPLPDVPEDIVARCIELLRLRATAPLALPCNLLTGISCLDQELQRFMQLLMSNTGTAVRIACQLLDLMAATPTTTTEDASLNGAAGLGRSAPATPRASPSSPAAPLSRFPRTLSTSELAANRQFVKDATTLFVSLVKQNQAAVSAFFLLPDSTVDTATLKPLDAPLDPAEERAVQYGLWNRLWRVARQHVHVPSFALALDKLLQQLLRCRRSMTTASEDNELTTGADPNASEPLTETLIAHPRHPHRLRWTNIRLLSNYEDGGYVCNVCGVNPGFDYCFHCSSCQFDLCANCSRERLTLVETQQRARRAAALMLQSVPETVTSMMRLLRHPLCRSDIAMGVVHLMSFGLQECGAREGVSMLSGDAAGGISGVVSPTGVPTSLHSASAPLQGGGGSARVGPIQLLEQELVELAEARVRALKKARDEFRQEVYAILHTRSRNSGHSAGVGVAAVAPTRSQLTGGTSVNGLSGRHTWQQLSIPEDYVFDTDTAMALLVKLDIKNSEGDAIQLLFEPYVATMRSEPRAFTMLWRASQAYLLDVSTLLEHVAPKEVLPLPSCVSSILQTFCKYHMSESRLLGASASARVLTDSRSSLAGETEHFLHASTKPSSVSDRAVRELAEHPEAAHWMTAAGTRLSEEGPKSAEELQHRRLPRVVRMVLEENRTTLNTLFHWDGNLLKDSFAFLKYEPNLIDFNFKLTDFRRRLGLRRGPNILLRVNRQTCLLDSFKELQKVKSFGGQLHIRFHGEEGADAGGLTREWLQLLSESIVDESYALFIHSQDGMSFQPNPFSSVNPNHLEYFQFAGVVTGLAIAHNVPIDIHFTRAFYRHIIGHRPVFSDLQSFDPELYTNLNWIMENDVTDLGLTFAVNYDRFGSVEEEALEPNGKDTAVTNANKQQYVRLLCEFHMTRRTEDQLLRFLKGFYSVIPRREIQCFTENELELVISGMPNIDVEDLRTHTLYEGYSSTSPQVRWFWEAVGSMSKEDLANLLQFTTGSSKVPHGGFGHLEGSNGRSLPFTISRWAVTKEDLLPQAHTCFNKIDLPVYNSAAVLKEKLMLAITYGTMGFTMV
ncbi:putative ubiquitin-protein ligase-like [Leishmania braziliensis MHOM/BR/75/M2904]|uniref:HECT-type E3 ubiquitin transferase n=2 Tax=Leishmania braziliensis TaxID=5660 RepID=A4H4X3_LEIBR|nr:putative ubiquitin-protein ligase-like [Leishmania braziliensis MHOM/BR/75/M2904]CAJ2466838.1 unnamed protein product [Leishmania braziliensis]CAM41641.1 putative ubiquitin-protein ligase-like [Leishmania braziliensis MHOM/BR/75/M2904]SYZ62993.1 ubiquitin-protein_ligase-like [Leishmania braziliensis MHOM/BR/75/M2904]